MIDNDKLNHIIGVARLMKDRAVDFGLDAEEMFTLGMLHDIGFEFGTSEEHHKIGYEILKSQGYKYATEVLYHGMPTSEYSSTALDLLNYADLHISKTGDYVPFSLRLEDIKNRRGENSKHYINCKMVIDGLKAKYKFINNEDDDNLVR